jgi:TRAP-type transport system periplasmic protein
MRTLAPFALVLLAASGLGAQDKPAAAEFVMTLASVAPQDSPWHAVLSKLEKDIEAKSGGRIDVKLKIGGVLGDENETVTKCRRGQIQAVGASTGALASIIPELNVVELPYLFRNPAEADHILDNVLMEPLDKAFRTRGLVLGLWAENGYRNFGTRDGAVKKPDDLKGKKMRSQESPVHIAMYRAFGASAVPIPTTEVPQALATGNVDGFDQSALYTIAASWYKSIKHYTLSEHIYQPAAIAYNAEWFGKLPPDLQKILLDTGRSLQGKGRKIVRDIFPELINMFKANGVTVHELTADERLVFEKAARAAYTDFRKTHGKEAVAMLEQVDKALAEMRKGSTK